MNPQETRRVTTAEAVCYECPRCLAGVGDWCVYVPPPQVNLDPERDYAPTTRVKVNRVGTRSITLHQQRFNVARQHPPRTPPSTWRPLRRHIRPDRERFRLQQIQRHWELDEYLALQTWLREHGRLFQELVS